MSYNNDPTINWASGTVLLRDGDIFCSPNSKRAVLIADEAQARSSPFYATSSTNKSDITQFNFFQPVWWDWSHGWIAFVPTSPSFLSLPFQQLSWKPRIIPTNKPITLPSGASGSQRRYTVRSDDCQLWLESEERLVRAANDIRMYFHIPGTVPPLPSSFGLAGLHKSRNVADRCIHICRKWFAVWMGFLSYLIAQTTRPEYRKIVPGPLPTWYSHLLEKGFPPPWLDGLTGSTVCAFEYSVGRAGVILSFTDGDRQRPPAQWFIAHCIPCWYPLTKFSVNYLKKDSFLRRLVPPNEKLQEALTMLFNEPRLPLVLFILKQYNGFEWTEFNDIQKLLDVRNSPGIIMEMCANELAKPRTPALRLDLSCPVKRDQVLAEMKVILADREEIIRAEIRAGQVTLEQGMVERDDFEGMTSLHASWSQYFEKRAKRETELLANESDKDRHARIQREENRPMRRCKMYTWRAVKTSGAGIIYARTLMKQSEHEDLVTHYRPSETKFNARSSEWDFFEEFDSSYQERTPFDDTDESDSESDRPGLGATPLNDNQEYPKAREPSPVCEKVPEEFYTTAGVEGYRNVADCQSSSFTRTDPRMVERAHWEFGFVPPLGQSFTSEPTFTWKEVLHTLGTTLSSEDAKAIPTNDMLALQAFFSALVSKKTIPSDLDDLSRQNHRYVLSGDMLGNFSLVGANWFIFTSPRSSAASWFLGVDSAAAVLYILRILASTRQHHTMLTLGHLLIQNGVKFRTFERLPVIGEKHPVLWEPFQPRSYRQQEYKFTAEDFKAALLHTKYLLWTLPGRAALLSGGIIGRIAREFLLPDDVLDGPSVEATYIRKGFCVKANDGQNEYWDDDLTEQEKAIICGTYIMYTGKNL